MPEPYSARAADLLAGEWRTLRGLLPELADYLQGTSLQELENPDGRALRMFKDSGATGFAVSRQLGGLALTAEDLARIYRAIGSRAPSLALATTRHHLSITTIAAATAATSGVGREAVQYLVTAGALLASGLSEGTPGDSECDPTAYAVASGSDYVLTGHKSACCPARSMDVVLCSVLTEDRGRALALVPADAAGLTLRPFWAGPVLRATESEDLVLDEVRIARELVVAEPDSSPNWQGNRVGYVLFTVLTVASYLGMATALLQRALDTRFERSDSYVSASAAVESTWSALVLVCRDFDAGVRGDALSARIMCIRYALQDNLARISTLLVEAIGTAEFCASPQVPYLASALHALALHPPGRRRIASAMYEFHLTGQFGSPTSHPGIAEQPSS